MRCSCVKNAKSCTTSCRCVNWGNSKVAVVVKKRRNREQHDISPSHVTSLQFLLSTGEDPNLPNITRNHYYVLEALLFNTMKSCNFLQLEDSYLEKTIFEKFEAFNRIYFKIETLKFEMVQKWLSLRRVKESLLIQTVSNN